MSGSNPSGDNELPSISVEHSPEAFVIVDGEGRIAACNWRASLLLGWATRDLVGRSFKDDIVAPQHRQAWADAIHVEEDGSQTREVALLCKDGKDVTAELSYWPIGLAAGLARFAILVRDLAERNEADRARAVLAAIVSSSDDAIISKDLSGTIMSWNAAATRLFGYAPEEIIGRSILTIIPEDRTFEENFIQEKVRRGERVDHFETVRRTKSGSLVHLSITVSPIHDRQGKIIGASKVARDIGVAVAAQRELVRLNEELKATDERKDVFLATLAHELRGPLAPISNSLAILRRIENQNPQLKMLESIMARQVGHLTGLVNDLLEVSRITRNKIALQCRPIQLEPMLRGVVESMRAQFEGNGQRVRIRAPAQDLWIEADENRLTQIVCNLLTNASKFSPEGGEIEFAWWRAGTFAEISVKDKGIGIAPHQIGSIFNLFTQVAPPLDRNHGGLGIGLALVRSLTEMQGGHVSARSAGLGLGSEFVFRLPLTAASVEAEEPESADERLSDAIRLLIVDDNRDTAESAEFFLNLCGFEVRTAFDAETALSIVEQFQPRICLLDIGLPGMNGYQLAQALTSALKDKKPLLVAATGWGQTSDRETAMAAGFDRHLTKPVDLAAFAKDVPEWLKSAE